MKRMGFQIQLELVTIVSWTLYYVSVLLYIYMIKLLHAVDSNEAYRISVHVGAGDHSKPS